MFHINLLPPHELAYFAPELLVTVWAMLLLLGDAFFDFTPRQTANLALAGLGVATIETLLMATTPPVLFWNGMCVWDGSAKFFHIFFLVVGALVIWMGEEAEDPVAYGGEFAVLPLFTTVGLMLLASANDFMLLFVALELVTISFYILVAYRHRSITALEAGVKYLILGGLSSAFLVMGVAYIFGTMGTTRFDVLLNQFHFGVPVGAEFGLVLVLVGVGFKIAMVPFHIWAPDVYEGAPNSITAFLSVGSKAGGLIMLLRIALGAFGGPDGTAIWYPVLTIGAILSLLLGNLAAIPQRNLKRLLGYSSIGHSGFILVAVIGAAAALPHLPRPAMADVNTGQVAVAVYLVTYLLATFTCFIVLALLRTRLPGLEIHHLAGLSQRAPLLAAAFALALISLAGIPPLGGFIAKALVVLVAWNRHLYVLLALVLFAAVAALYYYLGPIKAMYWSEPLDRTPIRVGRPATVVLALLVALMLITGFFPQSITYMVNGATLATEGMADGTLTQQSAPNGISVAKTGLEAAR
jgi:NADH-quinone oxidoreductase subunit N